MNEGFERLLRELRSPSGEFSPWPFWFLNDALTPEGVRGQLADFHEKGIGGVVLHPRIGIPREMEYMSDSFLDAIECAVEAANALSMKVVLYDEGMYPSGSAHGEVVRSNPEFASVGLRLLADGEPGGEELYSYPDGARLVCMPSGGTIRGIHFGEDDGEADAPPSADILNPEAVRRFLALTHERYYARLRGHFGKTIVGVFTDEPCPLGRVSQSGPKGFRPWTRGLEKEIALSGGGISELRGLFTGEENDSCRIYRAVLRRRLNEAYYRQLSAWCEERRVMLMGHPERSDDIDEQAYFHAPGQDLIMRRVSPERGGVLGLDSVQAKCSSDAARHFGKRRNSNECFGVCGRGPWDLRGSDMKWMIDYLVVRGVNLLIPHAFYYSVRSPRHEERPPDVGPNNIWWKHYKKISDYVSRVCRLMTDSRNAAKVCVPCESRDMPADEIAYLYERQIEFNYLPVALLKNAEIGEGRLKINGYEYTHCVPREGTPLPLLPVTADGDAPRDLQTEPACPSLRATHIVKHGVDAYFCVNEGESQIDARVTMAARGEPVFYDPWRDALFSAAKDANGSIRLRLPPFESVVILMDASGGICAPEMQSPVFIDITNRLAPLSRDDTACTITYGASLTIGEPTGRETLLLRADDMAECYINGVFLDASFWNTHRFFAGDALRRGENDIRVVVTGSASNRYGSPVPYGIRP